MAEVYHQRLPQPQDRRAASELIIGGVSTIRFKVHDSLPVLNEAMLQAEGVG